MMLGSRSLPIWFITSDANVEYKHHKIFIDSLLGFKNKPERSVPKMMQFRKLSMIFVSSREDQMLRKLALKEITLEIEMEEIEEADVFENLVMGSWINVKSIQTVS